MGLFVSSRPFIPRPPLRGRNEKINNGYKRYSFNVKTERECNSGYKGPFLSSSALFSLPLLRHTPDNLSYWEEGSVRQSDSCDSPQKHVYTHHCISFGTNPISTMKLDRERGCRVCRVRILA